MPPDGTWDPGALGSLYLSTSLTIRAVFAILTALLAAARGRSAMRWFVAGMILPAVGMLLVLFLPTVEPPLTTGMTDEMRYRQLARAMRQKHPQHPSGSSGTATPEAGAAGTVTTGELPDAHQTPAENP